MSKNDNLKSTLSAFLITISSCAISYAEETANSPHEFSLGVIANYYKYDEPSLMDLKGYMIGGVFNYLYTTPQNFIFGLDADLSGGSANYRSNGTGKMKDVSQLKFEGRLKAGKNFYLGGNGTLTPYTGFGVRVKTDHSGGKRTTTGHYGYDRRSTYFYIPLGLKLKKQLSSDWAIESFGEYDLFIRGRQHSISKKHQFGTAKHTQKNGYGLKFGIDGVKTLQNKKSITVGPFVNYWNIKDSNSIAMKNGGYSVEPHNKTLEVGLAIKYRF